ncbi:MAG: DUF2953 domain-containing protein [Clostridia bacterium]|nr:DUF2953 domain-containing protein [Clostridia bacterium]
MLAFIALAYWLLCVRLLVRIEASVVDWRGSVSLSIGIFGVTLRYDAELRLLDDGRPVRISPRYRRTQRRQGKGQKRMQRLLRPYLRSLLTGRRFESISVQARIGTGDAARTAVLCGTVQTILYALLMPAHNGQTCRLSILPDYSGAYLCADVQGAFSCQAGDVVFAALRDARIGRSGE